MVCYMWMHNWTGKKCSEKLKSCKCTFLVFAQFSIFVAVNKAKNETNEQQTAKGKKLTILGLSTQLASFASASEKNNTDKYADDKDFGDAIKK